MRLKVKLHYIYIILSCIGMFMYFGFDRIGIPWWVDSVLCVAWIGVTGLAYMRNINNMRDMALIKCLRDILYYFGFPYILFWITSIISWMVEILNHDFDIRVVTRAVSTTAQYILILFFAIIAAYYFKNKLLKYTFVAAIANYSIVIIQAVMKHGVSDFIRLGLNPFGETLYQGNTADTVRGMLEVHDVTFALGFFLIYFFFSQDERIVNKKRNMLFCALYIYMGFKRIQLAALVAIICLAIFIRGRSKKSMRFWCITFSVSALVVLLLYIWLIDSGVLVNLAEEFGINFMGRLRIYDQLSQYFDFSPLYVGHGLSFGAKLGEQLVTNRLLSVGGHSDILQNYIDLGFWGFIIWIVFICYITTKKINLKYGPRAARIWILGTVYAVITYLTDNTLHYFGVQVSYIVVVFHAIYINRDGDTDWAKN